MGQKVNPVAFRTGKFKTWKSRWYADSKSYKDKLLEDLKIRDFLMKKLVIAGVESVEIERLTKSVVITLNVSRPGVVIGRGGSGIEELRREIEKIIKVHRKQHSVSDVKIDIQVVEVKNPEISAQLVAARIVSELERRLPHRRTVTRAMERVIQSGAKGVKIVLSGRIAGADISRVEKYHKGSVPTQTLRANVDYAQVPALLKRGYVGVKVWIYRENED